MQIEPQRLTLSNAVKMGTCAMKTWCPSFYHLLPMEHFFPLPLQLGAVQRVQVSKRHYHGVEVMVVVVELQQLIQSQRQPQTLHKVNSSCTSCVFWISQCHAKYVCSIMCTLYTYMYICGMYTYTHNETNSCVVYTVPHKLVILGKFMCVYGDPVLHISCYYHFCTFYMFVT